MKVKPILKWVGGKTQIIDKLMSKFPKEINNYHEPFLGGGSVLLALLAQVKDGTIRVRGTISAYDLNEPLINVYLNIQSYHNELYDNLQTLIRHYNECPTDGPVNRKPNNIDEGKQSKESFYYWMRSEYNKMTPEYKNNILGSAMFIFMNKTCFRGVFRVGPNGFNVPYGHPKNPEIINREHLNEIHTLIQGVVFECRDFAASLDPASISEGDFIYLDPPYAPETETSFVGYTATGFDLEKHEALFRICKSIGTKAKFVMSNADVKLVRDHFTGDKYSIESILCKRAINSKNPEAKTMEVLIAGGVAPRTPSGVK
jgi:DNA adenine methylase